MYHLESFISSSSERGDSLDPLHSLLLLDLVECLLMVPQCLVLRAPLLPPQLHCCLLTAEKEAQQPECLSTHWQGVSHILTGIPLKWTFLHLSLFHIPASSHAVHFSHCFKFTPPFSGASSSSQSLWWHRYNLHLWIFHPSTLLFLHCQCLRTKDQSPFNHVNSRFSSLLLIQFPLLSLSLLGLCPTPGYHCETFAQKNHPKSRLLKTATLQSKLFLEPEHCKSQITQSIEIL